MQADYLKNPPPGYKGGREITTTVPHILRIRKGKTLPPFLPPPTVSQCSPIIYRRPPPPFVVPPSPSPLCLYPQAVKTNT